MKTLECALLFEFFPLPSMRTKGTDRFVRTCTLKLGRYTLLAANCHFSVKIDLFSDNLPRSQALLEDQLSHITWRGIVRSSFFVLCLSSRVRSLNLAPRYLGDAPTNA